MEIWGEMSWYLNLDKKKIMSKLYKSYSAAEPPLMSLNRSADNFDFLADNFDLLADNFDLLADNFDLLADNFDLLVGNFDHFR